MAFIITRPAEPVLDEFGILAGIVAVAFDMVVEL